MKTANTVCGKCGAEIPAEAREGACPACLLETGLGLLMEEAVAGVDSSAVAPKVFGTAKAGSAKAHDSGHDDSARAADIKKAVRPARHGESVPPRTRMPGDCLLRGGLEQSVAEPKPLASLAFGD